MLLHKWIHAHDNQQGAIFVLFAVTFAFLMAFSAIAVDMGTVYVQKERLQNAADAAALAGAAQLKEIITDSTDSTITDNYVEPYTLKNLGDLTTGEKASYLDPTSEPTSNFANTSSKVNITACYYNATTTDSTRKLTVELRQNVPLYFMHYFGFSVMPVAVTATAQFTPDSGGSSGGSNPFSYMFCAGDYDDGSKNDNTDMASIYMESSNFNIQGSIRTNGKIKSVHIPGTRTKVNGDIITAQDEAWIDSDGTVDLIGSHTTPLVSQSPVDISLEANSSVKNFVDTIKNMTEAQRESNHIFYGNVSGYGYVSTQNKYTGINVGGKPYTIIVAENNITADTIQNFSKNYLGDQYIVLISLNGNITIHNSGKFDGILYAPNGTIRIDGSGDQVFGSVVGKNIDITQAGTTFHYKSYLFGDNTSASTTSTGSVSLIK